MSSDLHHKNISSRKGLTLTADELFNRSARPEDIRVAATTVKAYMNLANPDLSGSELWRVMEDNGLGPWIDRAAQAVSMGIPPQEIEKLLLKQVDDHANHAPASIFG